MANIWQILYPYSSSKRLGRFVVTGVFVLLFTYILAFYRAAMDITTFKDNFLQASFMGSSSPLDSVFEEQSDWQTVHLFPGVVLQVYSAFLTPNKSIVIIGAIPPASRVWLATRKDKIYCTLYRDNNSPEVGTTRPLTYGESMVASYTHVDIKSDVLLLSCPYYKPAFVAQGVLTEVVPTHVSVSGHITTSENASSLKIHKLPNKTEKYRWKLSMCVLPTDFEVNVIQFLEWFTFQQATGVDQLTIYNMRIGPNVKCIIDTLANSNDGPAIHVLPWHSGGDIRHLDVAETDCQYRLMQSSKDVDVADLEDFSVTKKQIRVLKEQFNPDINDEDKRGRIIIRGIDLTKKLVAHLKHLAGECGFRVDKLLKRKIT